MIYIKYSLCGERTDAEWDLIFIFYGFEHNVMTTWLVVYLVLCFCMARARVAYGSEIDIKRHENINGIYYYKFHARLNKYFIYFMFYSRDVCVCVFEIVFCV